MMIRLGVLVCDRNRPSRLGHVVARARAHGAWVVRWERAGCTVVDHDRLADPQSHAYPLLTAPEQKA
jgi:hypothetical protein